jgi:hypothetical protein
MWVNVVGVYKRYYDMRENLEECLINELKSKVTNLSNEMLLDRLIEYTKVNSLSEIENDVNYSRNCMIIIKTELMRRLMGTKYL